MRRTGPGQKTARREVDDLKKEQLRLLADAKKEEIRLAQGKEKITLAALSVNQLQERSQDLLTQIKALENQPAAKKVLRYRTPVSRVVDGEELMFECKEGKVSYIDLPAFMHEIKDALNDDKLREIAKGGSWDSTTSTIGAFRLRFSFQAVQTLLTAPGSFRIQLASWIVEPITPFRGENIEQASEGGLGLPPARRPPRSQPHNNHLLGLSRQLRPLPNLARSPL